MNYFKSDAVKAVREASISIACLSANQTDHFEDENATYPTWQKKWVLKDQKGLQRDLDHIQDQITILENHLDPYIPDDNSKLATPQQQAS